LTRFFVKQGETGRFERHVLGDVDGNGNRFVRDLRFGTRTCSPSVFGVLEILKTAEFPHPPNRP